MKITDIRFHRNGINGEGFHAVQFQDNGNQYVAIVFEALCHVAVLDLNNLDQPQRGDLFTHDLRAAIETHQRQLAEDARLAMQTETAP